VEIQGEILDYVEWKLKKAVVKGVPAANQEGNPRKKGA
jgi:hypothetical protein